MIAIIYKTSCQKTELSYFPATSVAEPKYLSRVFRGLRGFMLKEIQYFSANSQLKTDT